MCTVTARRREHRLAWSSHELLLKRDAQLGPWATEVPLSHKHVRCRALSNTGLREGEIQSPGGLRITAAAQSQRLYTCHGDIFSKPGSAPIGDPAGERQRKARSRSASSHAGEEARQYSNGRKARCLHLHSAHAPVRIEPEPTRHPAKHPIQEMLNDGDSIGDAACLRHRLREPRNRTAQRPHPGRPTERALAIQPPLDEGYQSRLRRFSDDGHS